MKTNTKNQIETKKRYTSRKVIHDNPIQTPEISREILTKTVLQSIDDYINLETGTKEFQDETMVAVLQYQTDYDRYWIAHENDSNK